MNTLSAVIAFLMILSACSSNQTDPTDGSSGQEGQQQEENPTDPKFFFYGADLSYVNEMEDCGAQYHDNANVPRDPYEIFGEAGANLIRLRLWHDPSWTDYSNFEDVKKSIRRAKALGMQVLLDFHYSDTWADPAKQEIPTAWVSKLDDTEALGNLLYAYTYETLNALAEDGLLPEMVQVGNEINPMILQQGELEWPIDWVRNAALLNKGIKAVRDIASERNTEIGVMLHIAQPENALWWFQKATDAGVLDYDWIGLSYYPLWSEYGLDEASEAFSTLITTYNKRLMVVETAYPFTLENADQANNILGSDALVAGFPASPEGQLGYLNKLRDVIQNSGGEGLIYWEPAWVSTNCGTLWAQGSHWDNATLFDHDHKATKAMEFYNAGIK